MVSPSPLKTLSAKYLYVSDPGVSPEENAVVGLCRVIGSGQEDAAGHARFLALLGVVELPMGDTGAFSEPGDITDAFINQQSQAMTRPWTDDEFPLVADWIESCDGDLDACAAAVQRPGYFLPLVDTLADDEPFAPLVSVLLTSAQNCRSVARGRRKGSEDLGDYFGDLFVGRIRFAESALSHSPPHQLSSAAVDNVDHQSSFVV